MPEEVKHQKTMMSIASKISSAKTPPAAADDPQKAKEPVEPKKEEPKAEEPKQETPVEEPKKDRLEDIKSVVSDALRETIVDAKKEDTSKKEAEEAAKKAAEQALIEIDEQTYNEALASPEAFNKMINRIAARTVEIALSNVTQLVGSEIDKRSAWEKLVTKFWTDHGYMLEARLEGEKDAGKKTAAQNKRREFISLLMTDFAQRNPDARPQDMFEHTVGIVRENLGITDAYVEAWRKGGKLPDTGGIGDNKPVNPPAPGGGASTNRNAEETKDDDATKKQKLMASICTRKVS